MDNPVLFFPEFTLNTLKDTMGALRPIKSGMTSGALLQNF